VLATDIEYLDACPIDDFRRHIGPLFEEAPGLVDRLADARPFGTVERLFGRALAIAEQMPEREQIELLNAHPRLGAPPGSVSAMSFVEQGYDDQAADALAEGHRAEIDADLIDLNDAYESTFGFRYCVFVGGRPRAELVPGLRAALRADRESELRRGLRDVVAIARDRWLKAQQAAGGPG
jgi:2-oxo-4-hydroxy-4-carboxy--5-ureidoimidazoline (OHCU) decarboxylase